MILSQSLKENFNLIETSLNYPLVVERILDIPSSVNYYFSAHLFSDADSCLLCYVVPHSEKSVHCITLKFLS